MRCKSDAQDIQFMGKALELAARGLGRTSPNPAVGAVVVRDGEVIGEGYHHRAGEPHAEPLALAEAGEKARGADIYVTLEPCCHYGRTPPCTEAILAAGIARVFYACGDPDPRCAGCGAAQLRDAGLEVICGPLTDEALALNEAYFKHKRTGRPFVTLKLALSLDGKIATVTGDSKWITGEAARQRVHELRDRNDAVMVGLGTVLSDDPALTCRLEGTNHHPARVILDSSARTPTTAKVLACDSAKCLIAVAQSAPADRVAALEAAGAEIVRLPGPASETQGSIVQDPYDILRAAQDDALGGAARRRARMDYHALLQALGERNIMSVLCEGGATVAARLLLAGAVDKLLLFYAPKIIGGGQARSAVGDLGITQMTQAMQFEMVRTERIGDDLLVECRRR